MKEGEEVTSTIDPQSTLFIHIRPDKRYRWRKSDESSKTGIWHMNGHRPLFTLIDDDRSLDNMTFSVAFADNQLMMKQEATGLVYTYQRIFEFPN